MVCPELRINLDEMTDEILKLVSLHQQFQAPLDFSTCLAGLGSLYLSKAAVAGLLLVGCRQLEASLKVDQDDHVEQKKMHQLYNLLVRSQGADLETTRWLDSETMLRKL